MIRPLYLLQISGDRVCFDPRGEPVHPPSHPGSAVMVVSEVTDALKTVGDGLVTGALDRGSAALVTAFALDRGLLATAGPEPLSPGELIAAVRSQGVEWLLVGPDQPLRPLSAQ